jgi:hypothetical protein
MRRLPWRTIGIRCSSGARRAAEALLDVDTERALELMLDIYAEAIHTTAHDIADGIGLAFDAYASTALLAKLQAPGPRRG